MKVLFQTNDVVVLSTLFYGKLLIIKLFLVQIKSRLSFGVGNTMVYKNRLDNKMYHGIPNTKCKLHFYITLIKWSKIVAQ